MKNTEVAFPWTEKATELPQNPEPIVINRRKELLKKYLPIGSLFIFLLVMTLAKKKTPTQEIKNYTAPVVISPHPIKKGQRLKSLPLKVIQVSTKDLSRSQRLNLLSAEDLSQRNLLIEAKRDIAPRKPLFWSDLNLVKAVKAQKQETQIIYRRNK